jgi:hypothetical protein
MALHQWSPWSIAVKSPWVLLHGAGDGNLAILGSALAQPLRPWALGGALGAAGSGPAEEFLPGQLLLRRASGAWVERLREGPGNPGALWIGGKSMEIRCNLVYNHPEVEYQHFNIFQQCLFGRMFRNIHSLSNSMTISVKVVQEVCWSLPWLFVRPRCLMQGWFIKLVLNWRCEIGYYFWWCKQFWTSDKKTECRNDVIMMYSLIRVLHVQWL